MSVVVLDIDVVRNRGTARLRIVRSLAFALTSVITYSVFMIGN